MQLNHPLTLRHNFSWTLVGNGVYAACQWGMLVLLAKLGSPAMVGQFTLGLAITAPIFMLTNLQLRAIQATDAAQHYRFNDYLGLRLIGTGLSLLTILTIALLGYSDRTSWVILLIGLTKSLESISDVLYGLLQQHERMDRIAISLMSRGCFSLLVLGFSLYWTHQLVWGITGMVIVWATILLGYDLRSGIALLKANTAATTSVHQPLSLQVLRPHWHWLTLKKLTRLALPMGLVMMLISLNSNIPRYVVEHYLGEQELGIFAAIAYLIMVGGTIIGALGQAASPRLAKYYAQANAKAFWALLSKLLGIGAVIGGLSVLVALIAGREILTLLYQPEYAQHTDLLVWLMVAGGLSYIASFLGYGMTAAQHFQIQLPLFISVTTVSALTCLWLIPSIGLNGAAIALILAAVVQAGASLGVILYAIRRISKYTNPVPTTFAE